MTVHVVIESSAQRCTFCGETAMYSGRTDDEAQRGYDAHFCDACDVWLEAKCDEDRCKYCHRRPLRPSMIKLARIDQGTAPPHEAYEPSAGAGAKKGGHAFRTDDIAAPPLPEGYAASFFEGLSLSPASERALLARGRVPAGTHDLLRALERTVFFH